LGSCSDFDRYTRAFPFLSGSQPMKKPAFFLGAILFLLTTVINCWLIFTGTVALGIFSLIGTVLVFSSGIIWLIRQEDQSLHLKNVWLILPLGVFSFGIVQTLQKGGMDYPFVLENIQEIGNVMMSRYQIGLWLVSTVLLLSFVVAGALMTRGKA
jgi:hypothetical protein